MIVALLLASAAVTSAVDADLAFARDAKRIGQWTAFRKWADRDAVMFTPHAVWAKTFLKSLKDPPRPISWRPASTYSSCDGRTAVNTGPWFTQDGRLGGEFTTVWQRTGAGWRWVYDGGIPGSTRSATAPSSSTRADCTIRPASSPFRRSGARLLRSFPSALEDEGRGQSADATLGWEWRVAADGERTFGVYLWNGHRFNEVFHAVAPPAKAK